MANRLRISLRILLKYRLYTGISLLGLSVAIASFWFIANYVNRSRAYDALQVNGKHIYRLSMQITAGGQTDHYAVTGKPLGAVLADTYTGVDHQARLSPMGNTVVKVRNERFAETGFFAANPDTFNVFSFHWISGTADAREFGPQTLLLSRELAEKYFSTVEVIDRTLSIGDDTYTVGGVYENWPRNSHLHPKALLHSAGAASGYELQDWFDLEHYTYVLLNPSLNQNNLDDLLAQMTQEQLAPGMEGSGVTVEFRSQALPGLYFEPGLIDDVPKGQKKYVHALTFAGLLVLLIAGLNYINLSLTRSTQRIKEIQLKKMLGITRGQLLVQSATESGVMTFMVLALSALLVWGCNGWYRQYSGFDALEIGGQGTLLLIVSLIIFGLGLLGSSYSGGYLSLSGPLVRTDKNSIGTFKKGVLAFQLAMAGVILIATLTMNRQIDFMKNKDLGFAQKQVMILDLPEDGELTNKVVPFRERIQGLPAVRNASLIGGGALPGEDNGKELFQVQVNGQQMEKVFNLYRVDAHFTELLDIQLAAGRSFEADRLGDREGAVLINQALARSLQWEDPFGKTIQCYGEPRQVIGVVQNFHNKSLHHPIEPIVFLYDENFASKLLVKTSMAQLAAVETVWADFFPDTPFGLRHYDQFLAAMYTQENHLSLLLGFFSVLALILCGMGLFAIFSLHMLQKTKEFSIRKVLGANALDLIRTATRPYMILAVLALAVAIPVAGYVMEDWLAGFSYRITMGVQVYLVAAAAIVLAGGMALSYHLLKSLRTRPAESLASE